MDKPLAAQLHEAVAAVCPIVGVSIGNLDDRSTWGFHARDDATEEQRAAAQAVIDTFEPG